MLAAFVGFVIAASTLDIGPRYFACFLFAAGAYSVNSCILGWVSATLGQTGEKKASALGFVNILGNASYIYTPYFYPASDGPQYVTAMSINSGFAVGTILCAWMMKMWLMSLNRKIRRSPDESQLRYAY